MGQYSWLYCDSRKQMVVGKRKKSYLLIPKDFGGGHIVEECYDGYGHMGEYDIYDLVADWNREWISQNPDFVTHNGIISDKEWYEFYADLSLSREEVLKKWAETGRDPYFCKWRNIGVDIACDENDNIKLKYPIKIAEFNHGELPYEAMAYSSTDYYQGCEEEDDEDEY